MSVQYDDYIKEHKENVDKAFEWLRINLPELFDDMNKFMYCQYLSGYHDTSKFYHSFCPMSRGILHIFMEKIRVMR